MLRHIVLYLGLLLAMGCSAGGTPLDAPVAVQGKVSDGQGKPIGDVVVTLQPLENGYVKSVEVKPDGTFSLETHPGKYAYYFAPKGSGKPLPPTVNKYAEASLDRTVQIASGKSLDIQVQ